VDLFLTGVCLRTKSQGQNVDQKERNNMTKDKDEKCDYKKE
jgi:hypothetical protein